MPPKSTAGQSTTTTNNTVAVKRADRIYFCAGVQRSSSVMHANDEVSSNPSAHPCPRSLWPLLLSSLFVDLFLVLTEKKEFKAAPGSKQVHPRPSHVESPSVRSADAEDNDWAGF